MTYSIPALTPTDRDKTRTLLHCASTSTFDYRLISSLETNLAGCPGQVPTPIGCKFLKSNACYKLQARQRRRNYTDTRQGVKEFLVLSRTLYQERVILANFRLPTCTTAVSPRLSLSALSPTFSPFNLTPPCSIMRNASVVLAVNPACLST